VLISSAASLFFTAEHAAKALLVLMKHPGDINGVQRPLPPHVVGTAYTEDSRSAALDVAHR